MKLIGITCLPKTIKNAGQQQKNKPNEKQTLKPAWKAPKGDGHPLFHFSIFSNSQKIQRQKNSLLIQYLILPSALVEEHRPDGPFVVATCF